MYARYKEFNGEIYEHRVIASLRYELSTSLSDAFADWNLSEKGVYASQHFKHIAKSLESHMIGGSSLCNTVTAYCSPADWTFWVLRYTGTN